MSQRRDQLWNADLYPPRVSPAQLIFLAHASTHAGLCYRLRAALDTENGERIKGWEESRGRSARDDPAAP